MDSSKILDTKKCLTSPKIAVLVHSVQKGAIHFAFAPSSAEVLESLQRSTRTEVNLSSKLTTTASATQFAITATAFKVWKLCLPHLWDHYGWGTKVLG